MNITVDQLPASFYHQSINKNNRTSNKDFVSYFELLSHHGNLACPGNYIYNNIFVYPHSEDTDAYKYSGTSISIH